MRTIRNGTTESPRAPSSAAAALLASLLFTGLPWAALPARAADRPLPVSPGAAQAGTVAEARCPTFSWAGVEGAPGYELAIFRIPEKAAGNVAEDPGAALETEPELVTRVTLPARTPAWTPPLGTCLERGAHYAWSVAVARTGGEPQWADPFLFTVAAAPSLDEVEQALAVLRRYSESVHAGTTPGAGVPGSNQPERQRSRTPRKARHETPTGANERPTAPRDARQPLPGPTVCPPGRDSGQDPTSPGCALTAPTGTIRTASAAYAPTLGPASLTVANQLHLGAASALFKDAELFLWSDTDNLALGPRALLSNATGYRNTATGVAALANNTTGYRNTATGAFALTRNTTGRRNTAHGDGALFFNTTGYENTASGAFALRNNTIGKRNTAGGAYALNSNIDGDRNTATGNAALRDNTTGDTNTAIGAAALLSNTSGDFNVALGSNSLLLNTSGSFNTAVGTGALERNTTGNLNLALGYSAGRLNTTGGNSIFLANLGSTSDNATIKIGTQGTQQTAFIAGIRATTTGAANAVPVLIDSNGQLGTASSSRRLKRDIQDLGAFAERVLELRPVAFRFRQHADADPDTPLEFGLIAEEVAEVFPELVVYDESGRPETVKYHLLSSLLLGQLREQHDALEEERRLRERLGARLARLEARVRKRGRR